MTLHTCPPSTWEMEAGEPGVQGHPWLHSELKASLGFIRSQVCKQTTNKQYPTTNRGSDKATQTGGLKVLSWNCVSQQCRGPVLTLQMSSHGDCLRDCRWFSLRATDPQRQAPRSAREPTWCGPLPSSSSEVSAGGAGVRLGWAVGGGLLRCWDVLQSANSHCFGALLGTLLSLKPLQSPPWLFFLV